MREPFTIDHSVGGGRAFIRGAGMLVLVVIAGIIALSSTSCVRTGHVGVVSIFGRVTGRTLSEGIHIVNPAASVTELSVKTQEVKEKAAVPSKEGLIMGLEASLLYHLDPARAATVYQQIGPTYADILLVPTFRSAIRAITAGNTAASLYSDGREGIAQQILEDVRRQVAPRGVIVENVLLRDLQLPETLKHAIEAKQQAQQEAQRMEYVLQREKQEAER
jgi:prohibitin 1